MPERRQYDDDAELTDYIWNHFDNLMSDFERRVDIARIAALKEKAGARFSEHKRQRFGLDGNLKIAAALANIRAFRHDVSRRLLAQFPHQIFVNRCSRCNRIVRTPKAQQCLWCSFDWHNK